MIIYSNDKDWIIVGGIYIAAQAEKTPLIREFDKPILQETSEIVASESNKERIITFVGHGNPGYFSGYPASKVVDYIKGTLHLCSNYDGFIDFHTCFGGIGNVEKQNISLVDAVKEAFPKASVRGALGAYVVDNGGKEYVVDPEKYDLAKDLQDSLISEDLLTTLDTILNDESSSLIKKGCKIRNEAANFYKEFLDMLKGKKYLLPEGKDFKIV